MLETDVNAWTRTALAFRLASLATTLLLGYSTQPAVADEPRLNVVMILADDQSYRDFGFMGNDAVRTPHLDRLASHSARYPNGYVPMSVCRPSLATLLTGLYPHQHGIHFNHPPPGLSTMRGMTAEEYSRTRARTDYLIQNVVTLPRVLTEAGYVCLQTGKHWEGHFRNAGFTHGMTLAQPADRLGQVTGTRQQDNGEWVAHGNGDAGLRIGRETMRPIFDFLDRYAHQRPFFIWYAPFLPHTPFDAPERFYAQYDEVSASRSSPPKELLPYYAQISRFDETVGQLLKYLADKQLTEETLVVFISDNGFRPDGEHAERHNQRSKLSSFEDGLRTPILLSLPGVIAPADHELLVHTIDIVPTILSAVGLGDKLTSRMQGHDLMASAVGREELPSRAVFGTIFPNDAQVLGHPEQHVRGRWVRDGDWKLVAPGAGKSALPMQLYQLSSDPFEEHNLTDAPEHAAERRRLLALIDDWWPARDNQRVTQGKNIK